MRLHRRRRRFERAGRLVVDELGLPRKRARELALCTAWLDVAGEALARRATPIAIRRGVLELAVADERWVDTLRQLIPRLAGRLAGRYPELGVRRFRVRLTDARRELLAGPLAFEETEPVPAADPPANDEPSQATVEQGSAVERLERLIADYLRRSSLR